MSSAYHRFQPTRSESGLAELSGESHSSREDFGLRALVLVGRVYNLHVQEYEAVPVDTWGTIKQQFSDGNPGP